MNPDDRTTVVLMAVGIILVIALYCIFGFDGFGPR